MKKEDIKNYKDALIKKFKNELDAHLRNLDDVEGLKTNINISSVLNHHIVEDDSIINYRENAFNMSIICKYDDKIEENN